MKLWLDDIRKAPKGYKRAYSVNEAINLIIEAEDKGEKIEMLDLDHDLGEFANNGGDGIKLLDWLVMRDTLYPIKLHTCNPVGREYMQRMINAFWNKEK